MKYDDTTTFLLLRQSNRRFPPYFGYQSCKNTPPSTGTINFLQNHRRSPWLIKKKKNGKELNNVWNVMNGLWITHPTKSFLRCTTLWNEELPAVHHVISRVWRRVGSVKGASASAERIFSLSGFILMDRRWNMDPETLTCIVLLHNWGVDSLLTSFFP